MKVLFRISVSIFGVTLFILVFFIISSIYVPNPIFETRYDNSPNIQVVRNLFNFVDAIGVPDAFFTLVSGILSFFFYKKSQ